MNNMDRLLIAFFALCILCGATVWTNVEFAGGIGGGGMFILGFLALCEGTD